MLAPQTVPAEDIHETAYQYETATESPSLSSREMLLGRVILLLLFALAILLRSFG